MANEMVVFVVAVITLVLVVVLSGSRKMIEEMTERSEGMNAVNVIPLVDRQVERPKISCPGIQSNCITQEEFQCKNSGVTGWTKYCDPFFMYPNTQTKGVYTFNNSLENRTRPVARQSLLPWWPNNGPVEEHNPIGGNSPEVENFDSSSPKIYCGENRMMPFIYPCEEGSNSAL